MRFLSFLDVTCCTLLCAIIIFKLQSASFPESQRRGKRFTAVLEVVNPKAKSAKLTIHVLLKDRKGTLTGAFELNDQVPKGERRKALAENIVLELPDSAADLTRYGLSIHGDLPLGSRLEIDIRQASQPIEYLELKRDLEKGLERLKTRLDTASGLGPLMHSNGRGLAILMRGETGAQERRTWLSENVETLKRCFAVVTGLNREPQGAADRSVNYQKELLLHFYKAPEPQSVYVQELSLNFCLVRVFQGRDDGRQTKIAARDVEEFMGKEGWPNKNGTPSPQILFDQLYYYFQHKLGNAELVMTGKPQQNYWETNWQPNLRENQTIRYSLERLELPEGLKEQQKNGTLVPLGNSSQEAFAHGRLFYEVGLNRLDERKLTIQASYGSQTKLEPEVTILDADRGETSVFRCMVVLAEES